MRFPFPKKYSYLYLLILLIGCVDPYEPEVLNTSARYLVVDGFINPSGPTSINLSRTMDLDKKGLPEVEMGAKVFVEEEGGARFSLPETSKKGTYTSATLPINISRRYRISILTTGNKSYISDFVGVKITPKIEDVTWRVENNGLQIYLNTQDKTGNTRYYRWEYDQTYEYSTPFYSEIEYFNKQIRARAENINRCWRNENSTTIRLGNSVRLQEDKIFEFPMVFIPNNSPMFQYKYSILVKQYAQTQEEYQYWETLRKNTENIGTLFDPLPTQLTGNLHAVNDPTEPVIGFIGAYSVETKRIFISKAQLPKEFIPNYGYRGCLTDTLAPNEINNYFNGGYIPITYVISPSGATIGYVYSTPGCVDCRLTGTNVKPGFWQ